jgi:hypothetical protein
VRKSNVVDCNETLLKKKKKKKKRRRRRRKRNEKQNIFCEFSGFRGGAVEFSVLLRYGVA